MSTHQTCPHCKVWGKWGDVNTGHLSLDERREWEKVHGKYVASPDNILKCYACGQTAKRGEFLDDSEAKEDGDD